MGIEQSANNISLIDVIADLGAEIRDLRYTVTMEEKEQDMLRKSIDNQQKKIAEQQKFVTEVQQEVRQYKEKQEQDQRALTIMHEKVTNTLWLLSKQMKTLKKSTHEYKSLRTAWECLR